MEYPSFRLVSILLTVIPTIVFALPRSDNELKLLEDESSANNPSLDAINWSKEKPISENIPKEFKKEQNEQTNKISSKMEKNYRISVLQPKGASSSDNMQFDNEELNVLVANVPISESVKHGDMDNKKDDEDKNEDEDDKDDGDDENDDDDESPEKEPLISPLIIYAIIGIIVLLLLILFVIIITVIVIACTNHPSSNSDDDAYCTSNRSCQQSDKFCEGGSEQTMELMERQCSSRQGSNCIICPKRSLSLRKTKHYSVSRVCNVPEDDLSPTSSASNTFKRYEKEDLP